MVLLTALWELVTIPIVALGILFRIAYAVFKR